MGRRQVASVLLGNCGSYQSCRYYFDTYHLPKYCFLPGRARHWKMLGHSEKWFRNGLKKRTTSSGCWLDFQKSPDLNLMERLVCAGQTCMMYGDPTSQFIGLQKICCKFLGVRYHSTLSCLRDLVDSKPQWVRAVWRQKRDPLILRQVGVTK